MPKAGTLTILAGGKKEDFDACVPVFEAKGKNTIMRERQETIGSITLKMCNQIAIAGAWQEPVRQMVYAKEYGGRTVHHAEIHFYRWQQAVPR